MSPLFVLVLHRLHSGFDAILTELPSFWALEVDAETFRRYVRMPGANLPAPFGYKKTSLLLFWETCHDAFFPFLQFGWFERRLREVFIWST